MSDGTHATHTHSHDDTLTHAHSHDDTHMHTHSHDDKKEPRMISTSNTLRRIQQRNPMQQKLEKLDLGFNKMGDGAAAGLGALGEEGAMPKVGSQRLNANLISDAAVDALFWDRDDAVKRLAALRTLEKAVACEGARNGISPAADSSSSSSSPRSC